MKDEIKNIITNLIGLAVLLASFYLYLADKIDNTKFGVAVIVSLALFLFKTPVLKDWVSRFLKKKTDEK